MDIYCVWLSVYPEGSTCMRSVSSPGIATRSSVKANNCRMLASNGVPDVCLFAGHRRVQAFEQICVRRFRIP